MAISKSSQEILLITDDDVILRDNYKQKILDFYQKYPRADIVAFNVMSIENQTLFGLNIKEKKDWL